MEDVAPARATVSFDTLLDHLAEVPRENGTAAIHQSAEFLREVLATAGVDVELVPFAAHPYGLRLTGVLALCGALLYARLAASGRHAVALVVAILVPAALVLDLDYGVPIFSWIGSQTQHHVVAHVAARQPARQLLFTAHYDTKTDALDHVERAPVEMAAPLAVLVMVAGALAGLAAARQPRRRRKLELASRIARAVAVVYGLAAFVVYSAGAFVPERSPGALDDGAATAVLVRLAAELAEGPPPARTGVEVVLFSAEEVGVQGSRVFAAERFRDEPALPTLVINLEGIGGSERHAVLGFGAHIPNRPRRRRGRLVVAVRATERVGRHREEAASAAGLATAAPSRLPR